MRGIVAVASAADDKQLKVLDLAVRTREVLRRARQRHRRENLHLSARALETQRLNLSVLSENNEVHSRANVLAAEQLGGDRGGPPRVRRRRRRYRRRAPRWRIRFTPASRSSSPPPSPEVGVAPWRRSRPSSPCARRPAASTTASGPRGRTWAGARSAGVRVVRREITAGAASAGALAVVAWKRAAA